MIHYFSNSFLMAYTACFQLPFGMLAVPHTDGSMVDCPKCLLALEPKQVNSILKSCVDIDEALGFLGRLDNVRAAEIYYKEA